MAITTNADVKKFIDLLKAGLKHGQTRELKNHVSVSKAVNGTNTPTEYYVHLNMMYIIPADVLEELFIEDDFDSEQYLNDLLA